MNVSVRLIFLFLFGNKQLNGGRFAAIDDLHFSLGDLEDPISDFMILVEYIDATIEEILL